MKKLIAILLIVLVAGFVFGADPFATLTLTSEVDGKLVHGFRSTEIATVNFGQIYSTLSQGGTPLDASYAKYTDENESIIDLEGSGGAVGYYYFATNSNTAGYNVDFTVNPFASVVGDVNFEVPYTLNYSSEGTSSNIQVNGAGTIALEGSLGGDISPKTSRVLSITGITNSPRYGGLSLAIVIAGSDNLAFGLPEGGYVATVVATLTTE